MGLGILFGIGGFVLILLIVVAVNTIRVGPPTSSEFPPPADVSLDEDAVANRLAEAIRFRTVSHGLEAPVADEALRGLRDSLVRNFPRVHETLKREIVNDYSLLYTWEGTDTTLKPILFSAHMDVVPIEPGTEGDWAHPPFSGAIADGFVWGRGTMDMKVSVIGILEAVEHLLKQGIELRRTVHLAFGHDEEVGGTSGAAKIADLLAKRGVQLDFTLDEGLVVTHGILPGVEKPVALVGVAEKGKVTLELTATGECGHSSTPPMRTAVGKLGRALAGLEAKPMPASVRSPTSAMFDYLAPHMPVLMRTVVANRWLLEPLLITRLEGGRATNAMIRTTIAPTVIGGGNKSNMVPCTARAVVDSRIRPGDSIESVVTHVHDTIDDPKVSVNQVGSEPSEPSPVSDIGSASFEALRTTIHQVYPDAMVAPGLLIGRTDSRHYVGLADNSFRFLPMRLTSDDVKRIHGTNERISTDNYAEIIRFYIQLMLNAANG